MPIFMYLKLIYGILGLLLIIVILLIIYQHQVKSKTPKELHVTFREAESVKVDYAKGEILVYFDDDDYYPPDYVERFLTAKKDSISDFFLA